MADRLAEIKPFRVMEVLKRAAELEAEGHSVVHFEVGEPDFATAEPIVAAGIEALQKGHTKYTTATGIPPLKEEIAAFYARQGVQLDCEQIVVTAGASGGLTLLAALLLNPDDELLITDPGYPCNEVFVHLCGAKPETMAVSPNHNFQPTVTDLCDAWGPATRGTLLASPANPTGSMLQPEVLAEIVQFVRQQAGFVLLDEIYQGIRREGGHSTGLSIAEDLFVLNSFSKYFGMTGWRLGWVVVPPDYVEPITRLCQNLFICPSTPAQYAALAGFSPAAIEIHEARVAEFSQRCALLHSGLSELGFTIPVYPEGAFYLYVDVSHTGMDSAAFCRALLDDFHVAVTPGEDFGAHQSDRYVRFAFTTSEASIAEGLQRIAQALMRWGV
ncbi:MAG: aminotransferase class I/II-fold pyridoxal phosphate-dependent enzyme [Pseudomonadales bacterium]